MPLMFLEVPIGLNTASKATMMKELSDVIDRTYRFPDTRVFLREYPAENVCQDGQVGGMIRPVAFVEAPELDSVDAKRAMIIEILAVMNHHYAKIADAEQSLVLINQYPLHNVGWLNQLQSDNQAIVRAVEDLNA